MSLSLSSLLNPSPTEDKPEQAQSNAATTSDGQQQSPTLRRDSLPPISYVQSPDLLHAQLPMYTPPPPRPTATSSTAGVAQQNAPVQLNDENAQPRRPSAGYATGGTFELPPPPVNTSRKMSSPTLDQYHVASRSPEQRRASGTISSGVVLAPLKTVSSLETTQEHSEGQYDAPADVKGETESKDAHSRGSVSVQEPSDRPIVTIKQEAASPQDTTSSDLRRLSSHTTDQDQQISRTLNTLKHEHTSRTHSPLRESSILPTTEEASPNTSTMKKRPAPSKKKGTATTAKKPRTANKKRKADTKTAIKNESSKGTPAMSSPAPSDSALAEDYEDDDESMVDSDEDVEGSGDVYCLCRKPDNGTFMIGCDGDCDDWFHGKCVGIEERDKNLIDKYICPRCAEAGVGRTSWKRMCRRQGCRLPARVGKNAGKNGSESKYCSDECGVLFFRQMTANTRGAEQARKDRASRRKSGAADQSDMGARGGILSTGEVRAVLDHSNTAGEFREHGNGVLSPPATPFASQEDKNDDMTELERDAVTKISTQKEQARQRHQLLKDRLKFIGLVKDEASRATTERDLKPKDYCGFDSRLEWTEEEFAAWRQSHQGQQAFELNTLDSSAFSKTDGDGEAIMDGTAQADEYEICSKKKCPRHHEWGKLTVDDVRFEMADNSDRMRSLEQQERDLKERASVRAKARKFGDDDGHVEVHDMKSEQATQAVSEVPIAQMEDTKKSQDLSMASVGPGEPSDGMDITT